MDNQEVTKLTRDKGRICLHWDCKRLKDIPAEFFRDPYCVRGCIRIRCSLYIAQPTPRGYRTGTESLRSTSKIKLSTNRQEQYFPPLDVPPLDNMRRFQFRLLDQMCLRRPVKLTAKICPGIFKGNNCQKPCSHLSPVSFYCG